MKKKMKKLLTLLLFIPSLTFAQLVDSNPDTVCFGSQTSTYQIQNDPNYTYNWGAENPGTILSNQPYTNTINIDWSAAQPGLISDAVWVFVTDNTTGCESDTTFIDVFIYQVIPQIDIIGPFCENEDCQLLTAIPTGGAFSGQGVVGGEFCPTVDGTFNIIYEYQDAGCTFSDNIDIIVNSLPDTPVIFHD